MACRDYLAAYPPLARRLCSFIRMLSNAGKYGRWGEVPPLSCPRIYQEQCSRANAARIVAEMECNYLYYVVILNEVKNLAMGKVSTLIASRAICLLRRHDSPKWDKCRYFYSE